MKERSLEIIALRLEAKGQSSETLHALQEELDSLERPPGLISRVSAKATAVAKQQWAHVVGELQESAEAMALVRRSLADNQRLTGAEADIVRTQMLDILRVVPASLIAAANAALPIPGTSVATPWLLNRLGMMPSRWREAHILSQLEKEIQRLNDAGHVEDAKALCQVKEEIEAEADTREQVEKDAAVLTFWDTNRNGRWDDDERAAYQEAVVSMSAKVTEYAERKNWFLLHEETVIGPLRLSTVERDKIDASLLICWQGKSGWVALTDIYKHLESDAQ